MFAFHVSLDSTEKCSNEFCLLTVGCGLLSLLDLSGVEVATKKKGSKVKTE